jgi:outer membrane protein assembly factor BamB
MSRTIDGSSPRLDDLVFVGFNRRVVALDRYSGEIRWDWKASKGGGYVSILIDGDRLIVNCQGYTWCLDPLSGDEVWFQPLKGFGMGIAGLASLRGGSSSIDVSAAASHAAAAQAAASGGAAGAAS